MSIEGCSGDRLGSPLGLWSSAPRLIGRCPRRSGAPRRRAGRRRPAAAGAFPPSRVWRQIERIEARGRRRQPWRPRVRRSATRRRRRETPHGSGATEAEELVRGVGFGAPGPRATALLAAGTPCRRLRRTRGSHSWRLRPLLCPRWPRPRHPFAADAMAVLAAATPGSALLFSLELLDVRDGEEPRPLHFLGRVVPRAKRSSGSKLHVVLLATDHYLQPSKPFPFLW